MSDLYTRIIRFSYGMLFIAAVGIVGFFAGSGAAHLWSNSHHHTQTLSAKSSNAADYPHLDGVPKATVDGPAENTPPLALPNQEGKVNGHISDPDQSLVVQFMSVKAGSSVWQTLSNDISFKQPNPESPDETVARLISGLQARMPGFDLDVVQPGFTMSLIDGQLSPANCGSNNGQ